ncbi:hypothetical protein N7523_004250 [Penicillium sp. IBT 18751x]|nr:hypothetical protein N7523_004250 [Penicillium sp. IBT 18751x]
MRTVRNGDIQDHAGDRGIFIARAWNWFTVDPDLHESSKASQTAPIESYLEKESLLIGLARGADPVPAGSINFEIVTESIGQPDWHDGLRWDGA